MQAGTAVLVIYYIPQTCTCYNVDIANVHLLPDDRPSDVIIGLCIWSTAIEELFSLHRHHVSQNLITRIAYKACNVRCNPTLKACRVCVCGWVVFREVRLMSVIKSVRRQSAVSSISIVYRSRSVMWRYAVFRFFSPLP